MGPEGMRQGKKRFLKNEGRASKQAEDEGRTKKGLRQKYVKLKGGEMSDNQRKAVRD